MLAFFFFFCLCLLMVSHLFTDWRFGYFITSKFSPRSSQNAINLSVKLRNFVSRIMLRTYQLYPLGLVFFLVHIKLLFLKKITNILKTAPQLSLRFCPSKRHLSWRRITQGDVSVSELSVKITQRMGQAFISQPWSIPNRMQLSYSNLMGYVDTKDKILCILHFAQRSTWYLNSLLPQLFHNHRLRELCQNNYMGNLRLELKERCFSQMLYLGMEGLGS